jgi:hypothetical protein
MGGKDRMCLHFPEQVLKQYGCIQTILRSPTTIGALETKDVVVTFQDFMVHVLDQEQRCRQTRARKLWMCEEGYIKWFYRVSHHIMSEPAPAAEYIAHVPPYEEVIVEQQWVIQIPDPLNIIANIRARVDSAMGHPDVFSSPLFTGVLQGIQSEYVILQEESVSQRRTRSHSPHQ